MKLTVLGMGNVGLVTGTCFADMGNLVYCVDIVEEKIEKLKKGIMPIYEPHLRTMVIDRQARRDLIFTTDIKEALNNSNIIFIAVGTPMREDGSVNLDYIMSATSDIGNNISMDSLVVIKSTVPVGTCMKVKKHIENIIKDRNINIKIEIASNPEFLKEGSAVDDCMRPNRIVIGAENEEVFNTLKKLYSPFVLNHDKFVLMDIKSSEMTKYVANAMLATKISFMNEIANICELTGANVKNVRLGIGSDKRIGYDFIYAGCGYGGSCFPKDIQGLIDTAKSYGYTPKLLSNVEQVNKEQKMVLVNKIVNRFGEDLSNLTFAIWGLAFKPNTDDVREASSLTIISELIKRGAKVKIYDEKAMDNFKIVIPKYLNHYEQLNQIDYQEYKYDTLINCDALILITEWKEFRNPDFDEIAKLLNQKIIFDGRNIYDSSLKEEGFELYQIGC